MAIVLVSKLALTEATAALVGTAAAANAGRTTTRSPPESAKALIN
jgi:hypothetical protein